MQYKKYFDTQFHYKNNCFERAKSSNWSFTVSNKSRRMVADNYVKSSDSYKLQCLQCLKLTMFEHFFLAMYLVTIWYHYSLVTKCSDYEIIVYTSIMMNAMYK